MRHCMFIWCLVGAVSLGCGESSESPSPRGVTANSNSSDHSTASQDESGMYHGLAARGGYGSGPEVRLDAITLTAPATWKRTKPASSYYRAEFALPHVDKDTTDGRLMVSEGSGSIESNIDIFKSQFDTAGESAKQEQKKIAGLNVTFLDLSGAYTGQHGQSVAAKTQPDYRMILAVIPVGDQLHFIKAIGAQQTIAAHAEAINSFVCSVKLRNASSEKSDAALGAGTEVRVKPLTFAAHSTWKRTQPRSSLVQFEFALPHADKDTADGRLTLSIVSGTIKDNIDRWKGQFVGAINPSKQEEIEISGLKVTLVDYSGTFGEQAGMMAPVVNRPDYRMIAAVIPIGDQLYIVKAVGPKQTIAANVAGINSFVKSMRQDAVTRGEEVP